MFWIWFSCDKGQSFPMQWKTNRTVERNFGPEVKDSRRAPKIAESRALSAVQQQWPFFWSSTQFLCCFSSETSTDLPSFYFRASFTFAGSCKEPGPAYSSPFSPPSQRPWKQNENCQQNSSKTIWKLNKFMKAKPVFYAFLITLKEWS